MVNTPVLWRQRSGSAEGGQGHQPQGQSYLGQAADCFLTTAACGALQLDDTCWELTELRHFRDNSLRKTKEGLHSIAEYYAIAPRIVAQINRTEGALYHYHRIYWQYILPCAMLSFLRWEKDGERPPMSPK